MKAILAALFAITLGATSVHGQSFTPKNRSAQSISPQAISSPLGVIYRVSGLRDNGITTASGVASTISCTNFSAVTERLRFSVYNYNSSLSADKVFNVNPRTTFTASTHDTTVFTEDTDLATGSLVQGMAIISSTSSNVQCTAMVVDAGSLVPAGISLHMVRFNAQAGSME